MGGTSAINAAAALWPRPSEFDDWVKFGDSKWSFPNVQPYFQRLEADRSGVGSITALLALSPSPDTIRETASPSNGRSTKAASLLAFPPSGITMT